MRHLLYLVFVSIIAVRLLGCGDEALSARPPFDALSVTGDEVVDSDVIETTNLDNIGKLAFQVRRPTTDDRRQASPPTKISQRALDEEETPLEKAILDRAWQCDRAMYNRRDGKLDRKLLRDMLRLEEKHGVPLQLRGAVLAAACHESGLTPLKLGDFKCAGEKRLSTRPWKCENGRMASARAVGILQQWKWVEGRWGYGINRRKPQQAADAWVQHLVKQVPKVAKLCKLHPVKHEQKLWKVAWVTSVRAPSKKPRCTQTPNHWRRFLQWRATWQHLLPEA